MQNEAKNIIEPELVVEHYSSCAIYNEPAFPKGECNCGGYRTGYIPDGKGGFIPYNRNEPSLGPLHCREGEH